MDDPCKNCGTRKADGDWVGEGGTLAMTHGWSVRWCRHCMTEKQLEHAEKMAAMIPELRRVLQENP